MVYKSKIITIIDERVKKILEDVGKKDSTWSYIIDNDGISLLDNDKNRLHKRSLWLTKKCKIGDGYNIRFEK